MEEQAESATVLHVRQSYPCLSPGRLPVNTVGSGQGHMGELLEAESLLLPSLQPLLLPLQDPGGGQGGHPHPVPQEDYHVLCFFDDGLELYLLEEGLLSGFKPELLDLLLWRVGGM